ncbi:Leucine-rich repeat extensin-like protein 6 [Acorus gramineus]|uniref:Cell wall hydroxyproline-rich glycoprotein n=1 Tax=Acorus gramineus TaxID=55184 RepID=A0AAV9B2F6_ACOGR|nr:Leucine-rich repeat extensin-like protein 6 [Acorus gramineus]
MRPHLPPLLLLLLGLLSTLRASPPPPPKNPRLEAAYIALQAWKNSIVSDPKNFTLNWQGPDVCSYFGIYCAPPPHDPHITTVAGIDLNHGDIAGHLPEDLGLLSDLALLHINSNRFCGTIPKTFAHLHLLHELDASNNRFAGPFPDVLLCLPSLRYLDIRYNEFEGKIPRKLFDHPLLDGVFLNNNRFKSRIPFNIGNSRASVIVLANNRLAGCLPSSLGKMTGKLDEIILMNRLENFTYSYNYFEGEPKSCLGLKAKDDRRNCIPGRPKQRSERECESFLSRPVYCESYGCWPPPSSPPPPPHLPPIY